MITRTNNRVATYGQISSTVDKHQDWKIGMWLHVCTTKKYNYVQAMAYSFFCGSNIDYYWTQIAMEYCMKWTIKMECWNSASSSQKHSLSHIVYTTSDMRTHCIGK